MRIRISIPIALLVHASASALLGQDPDLEPGYPAQAYHQFTALATGPSVNVLIANIDSDPELEIIASAVSINPVHAWNFDGTPVSGWPPAGPFFRAFPAAGNLNGSEELEIVCGYPGGPGSLLAHAGDGASLPGWPRLVQNSLDSPPSLGDVDGDGLDEIFCEEQDGRLHGYRADGSILPGWPADRDDTGQAFYTPAIADLDGDGVPEIVTINAETSAGIVVLAWHANGQLVDGFPARFPFGYLVAFPAIGDVDGDGELEIVFVRREDVSPWRPLVSVLSRNGVLERSMVLVGEPDPGAAPALADLSGDGIPEIVIQTVGNVNVFRGTGGAFPGWPRSVGPLAGGYHNSAPVIGDVDGDRQPDVVVTAASVFLPQTLGFVFAFDRNGVALPYFPKSLPIGPGGVPAIADTDLDGRNEIIVRSTYWDGTEGMHDFLWVYDLGNGPHGRIEWGQFGGNARRDGLYRRTNFCAADLDFDNDVDISDLMGLLGQFGCTSGCTADINGSRTVDLSDLNIVLAAFGSPCP